MNQTHRIALAALVLLACDLEVSDLNNPSLDDLQTNPTRTTVAAAATGLIMGNRIGFAEPNGYVSLLGMLGRESYNMDASDPRFISAMLVAEQLDPGNASFGGNFWIAPYANIRGAYVLLDALARVPDMTEAEREAIRGYAKTIQALDHLVVFNTRGENGGAIAVADPEALPPLVPPAALLQHINSLLDEGAAHLANGGSQFPFALSSGFKGLDMPDKPDEPATPSSFARFNRAIRARAAIYGADYETALQALEDSFLTVDPNAPRLARGAYHVYSGYAGDARNGLTDPNLYAHESLVTDAEVREDGTPDARLPAKLVKTDPMTVQNVTSSHKFTPLYPTNTTPVPIIRNEELILLRAEANIGLGNIEAAAADINFVRAHSGKLPERTDLTARNILEELLKQRRYSLMFEGGHRWIDARRYGRLDKLPLDHPSHHIHEAFPVPLIETDARQ
jgi:starch-binding outer membrane protein, SusD/RagB family